MHAAVVLHAIIAPTRKSKEIRIIIVVVVVGMDMMASTSTDPLLPPGFRFYPTEEELLSFYLRHRLAGTRPDVERFIPVVDLYSYHPRDLQPMAGAANVNDAEQWFFFCPRAPREAHGGRPARTTPSGYWKATGSPSWVFSSSSGDHRVIGERRTMVFYTGRAPAGTKTRWKMNEYKLAVADHGLVAGAPPVPLRDIQLRNEFSVCRVYISTGTVRSFDRRPLDLNVVAGHHDQSAPALHQQQQQRQQQLVQVQLPPAPAANTSSNNSQLDDRSSPAGPRGGMVVIDDDDGAADDIDWWDDSLMIIPSPDGLSFVDVADFAHAIWP